LDRKRREEEERLAEEERKRIEMENKVIAVDFQPQTF